MEIQRKALFNLLRMNWLLEPIVDVVDWQVEDYRALSLVQLFQRLEKEEIRLDQAAFLALSESCDTPEELADNLIAGREGDSAAEDRIYLLVFELWRRLLPEKSSLSIFCDELDHQISLYDAGEVDTPEHLEDALANLQAILDENTDIGNEPHEVFNTVSEASANDLEDFIYDFVADQIDQGNWAYAEELVDGFYQYMMDVKWFDLLRVRILATKDLQEANLLLRRTVMNSEGDAELPFILEALSFMVQGGEREMFIELVRQALPLLKQEGDLKDLMATCADYYQRLDYEWEEITIQEILAARRRISDETPVNLQDPVLAELFKVVTARPT